jgi:hypothetical protein
MGFTDNVFDQKRGQRIGNAAPNGNPSDLPSVSQVSGQKRQISMSDLTNQGRPLRTLEFPALEPENTGPEYVLDAHFASATRHRLGGLSSNGSSDAGPTLPGIASLPQHHVSSANSRVATGTSTGEGMKTLASAAASHGRTSALSKTSSVPSSLPPLTTFDIHNPYNASTQNGKQRRDLNQSLSVDSSKDTSIVDAAIAQKENRIAKLRRYGDELIQLGLKDSHKVLSQELLALEADLRAVKKQKSAALIENLRMEFPGLADVARKEVEKLGYA